MKIRDDLEDIVFLIPAIILFAFVVIIPFASGIGISLTNWNGISKEYDYIGIRNFIQLLKDDSLIGPLKNTFLFTLLSMTFVNLFGLLTALGININFKGSNLLKSIYFLPITISIVFSAYIWTYIYAFVFPALLNLPGLLGDKSTVMLGIAIMSIWRDTGFAMIIYYAGIKGIPQELIEAARVDGANVWNRFRHVTFPMIAPSITINVSLFLGWGIKVFEQPMAATKGGPGTASETLALYVYKYTFPYNRAGYGQAAGIIMLIMVVAITGLITGFLRKKEVEL